MPSERRHNVEVELCEAMRWIHDLLTIADEAGARIAPEFRQNLQRFIARRDTMLPPTAGEQHFVDAQTGLRMVKLPDGSVRRAGEQHGNQDR